MNETLIPEKVGTERDCMKNTPAFDTKNEAIEAGYEAVAPGFFEKYSGVVIAVRDTSGENSFGYQFSVCIEAPRSGNSDHVEMVQARIQAILRKRQALRLTIGDPTVTVTLRKELNRIGGTGSFCAMWPPNTFPATLNGAYVFIDKNILRDFTA